ncbi:hypothetical protein [uncultured Deefgea sp.]|uniref:hypothetical protein n=1 Tax=uncultured Deefgea sp. TaxID=1304914 RepID=UPI0025955B2E|nr:hypothetical protein [uncultured Deefgea sp.]
MFKLPVVLILALLLNGCAVVTTAALVGSVAVGVTTSAVGLAYDATKMVATGTVAAGGMAIDAMSASKPASNTHVSTPPQTTVQVMPLKEQ